MMLLVIKIFNFHLKVIYFFLKMFKTQNKISFLSWQTDKPSLDFNMLVDEIKRRDKDIKIVVLCKKRGKGFINTIKYCLYMYKQMYHIATSKVCVVDTYIPTISILKHKKSLKVLQIWHSLGAVKKFGYQTAGKVSGRSKSYTKGFKMHKNYDAIISTSPVTSEFYKEAFGYPIEKFYNYGLPRIDYLFHQKDDIKKRILKSYPELGNGKQNILYAPTFRTTKEDKAQDLIDATNLDKYNLIIIEHCHQKLDFDRSKVFTCPEFSSLELLSLVDYLITDYSAVSIEALILDVKTYYFLFDYETYKKNNGLNIDLFEEMKGYVFTDEKELLKSISSGKYDMKKLKKFKDRYLTIQDETSTKLIVDLILKWYQGE